MFERGNAGVRQQGVRTAVEGEAGRGKPQTLINMMPMTMHGLQYYDEQGRQRVMVVVEMGGQYYAPPNSHEWAERLKPLSGWMAKQIDNKEYDQKPVDVPEQDEVDVMGGESQPVAPVTEQATEG
jgi:hypothetical protein